MIAYQHLHLVCVVRRQFSVPILSARHPFTFLRRLKASQTNQFNKQLRFYRLSQIPMTKYRLWKAGTQVFVSFAVLVYYVTSSIIFIHKLQLWVLNWCLPVKDHVKARSRRGWRQISTKSKPIGRVEHFCNDLFRQRKISKNDQIAAISKPFDKREIKEHEFEESPLYIDWDQILKITRSFIEKVMNPQTAVENLLEQIFNREVYNFYRKTYSDMPE